MSLLHSFWEVNSGQGISFNWLGLPLFLFNSSIAAPFQKTLKDANSGTFGVFFLLPAILYLLHLSCIPDHFLLVPNYFRAQIWKMWPCPPIIEKSSFITTTKLYNQQEWKTTALLLKFSLILFRNFNQTSCYYALSSPPPPLVLKQLSINIHHQGVPFLNPQGTVFPMQNTRTCTHIQTLCDSVWRRKLTYITEVEHRKSLSASLHSWLNLWCSACAFL